MFFGRRFGQKYLGYADIWWFLSEARKIKKGDFKLSSKYREDRPEWMNHYPPLFLYLLAVVPDRYMDYMIKYAAPFMDALLASVLFSSIVFMTNNFQYGVLGVVVYLSSPMIFQQNFSLSVRPLSIFLVSIIYLVSYRFSPLNLLILSILISIALLLHKFAAQVLFFTSLGFLLIGSPDYLLSVVAGFLIAIIVSKGYYVKVFREHINHLKPSALKGYLARIKNPLRRAAALAVYCLWLIYFIVSICVLNWDAFSGPLLYSSVWIITLAVFSVITNFGILRIIGEGWRYLGYLGFPISFYVVSVIGYSPILLWMYMILTLLGLAISSIYTSRLCRKNQKFLIDQEDIEIFKNVRSVEGNRIIAYPNEFTQVVSYFSEKDYVDASRFADIIVINQKFTDENLLKIINRKGYSKKIEKRKWIVYVR